MKVLDNTTCWAEDCDKSPVVYLEWEEPFLMTYRCEDHRENDHWQDQPVKVVVL